MKAENQVESWVEAERGGSIVNFKITREFIQKGN